LVVEGVTRSGWRAVDANDNRTNPQSMTGPPSDRSAINVLVTAAGRRTSLVRAFMEAVHPRAGRVYAGDLDPLAPSLYLADEAIRLRRTTHPEYLPDLLTIVGRHAIGLIVPTIDTDLSTLAAAAGSIAGLGCRVAISSESFVAMALDKVDTGHSFGSAGIAVPASWVPPLPPLASLPDELFVKPRKGSASRDIYRVTRDHLEAVVDLVPDPVVQEVLTGPEITIDALLDLAGRPIHYVPRRRIKTLAGESVQGVTLAHDAAFEAWIERVLLLSSSLGAIGPLTLQAFLTDGGPVLSEINARFGGGFPLGLAAGGAYPTWLVDMVEGRVVESRLGEYEPDLFMTRYHVEQFTRRPRW
jgi:carbamoyl-phosphate synthase large subunit